MRHRLLLPLFLLLSLPACGQTPLGDYTGHTVRGREVTVAAGTAGVRLTFYSDDVVRVQYLSSLDVAFDSSLVVVQDTTAALSLDVRDRADALVLATPAMTVRVEKVPVRVVFQDTAGRTLTREPAAGGFASDGGDRALSLTLRIGEHLYGTGERGTGLDLRGQRLDSYNTQVGGYRGPVSVMNINVPVVFSSAGYGVYVEDTWPGRWDLGAAHTDRLTYTAYGGELAYFFMLGEDVPKLLDRYTWLTGRPPMPPKWALGYLQSKYGYRDNAAARAVVDRLRAEHIPADGLILDLYWFRRMGDLAWNTTAFPDPAGLLTDLREEGIKTLVITEPYVTDGSELFYPLTHFASDYVTKNADGDPYRLSGWWSCGGCDAVLVDLTNPEARGWWWGQYEGFMDAGVAGLWTDLGEPERHPAGMRHALGPAGKVHNVFNLLWAKTVAEGFARYRPDERLVNLTRSGYAGIQRYGVFTWSGDVSRTFGGLAAQLPLMLTTGVSGLPYHSSDLGGFTGVTSPELYVRWMEMGALSAVARAHGVDNQPTEPWGFGEEAEGVARTMLRLRYRLLPYLYTAAHEAHASGLPIVRPLFFDDPDDPWLANEMRAYLLGDDLLVAPVVEDGARTRTLYLPRGVWVDYWTDERYDGGREVTVAAPLDRLPLFVRRGALLPMQPDMPYVGARPVDTMTVAIYPDPDRASSYTLYEDDGASRDYEHGASAETILRQAYDGTGLTLTFEAARGSYEGQRATRTWLADVHHTGTRPAVVTKDGEPIAERPTPTALYAGGDGWYYDEASRRLWIQTTKATTEARAITVAPWEATSMAVEPEAPSPFALDPPYPNPFRQSATLPYRLPDAGHVLIELFDLLGRRVALLADTVVQPGLHTARLAGAMLPAGVYFARLRFTAADGLVRTAMQRLMRVR